MKKYPEAKQLKTEIFYVPFHALNISKSMHKRAGKRSVSTDGG